MPCPAFRPFVIALVALACLAGSLRADDVERRQPTQETRERIALLIDALGAEEYAVRERAQNELARLGVIAFDDLLVARENPDIEISQRAQYLIERMGIELIEPDDPQEVRQILGEYQDLHGEDRIRRMQRLALLPDWQGATALCRLVRYDDTEYLSKKAALLLLEQNQPESPERREQLAEALEMTIQFSGRSAADWVRGYAETLRDPVASLPTWQATVDQEWAEYRGDPRQMERSLLRDLIRWHVDLLYETGRQAEAISTMESSLTLVDPSPPEVLETIDWLLTREAWSVIDLTYERFGEVCQGNPELVYRMAEVRLKQGRPDEADQLAAEARAIDPQKLQNHDILARALRERGMIDWAEAEYRYMLEEVEENSVYDVWFRYSFADMLHDQLRDGEAAEVLEPAVEALRDPAVAASLQNISLTPDAIVCRAHYFSACHFEQVGDLEKQASHLQIAIARNPADLDTLIALYNMPEEDERRRRQTLDYLERTRETIGQRLSLIEQRLEQETHQPHIEAYEAALAQQCNQYAWLVSNTEGDFEEALRVSERSLEIIADGPMRGGYLDTLAHCHAALEDYEQAVAVQQEAVALEPHSGLLQRELELFQAALAKQNAAATGE